MLPEASKSSRLRGFLDALDGRDVVKLLSRGQLHRGVTHGMLDVPHAHARLVNFEPHDLAKAGCVIEIAGIRAESAAA
jgi:hypothetical protein